MSSAMELPKNPTSRTAFLFDLDGTLVDSVYQHVLAWREAMAGVGIELAVWPIHRRIGMSGGLMANAHPPRDRPRGHPRGGRTACCGCTPRPTPGWRPDPPAARARELLAYLHAGGRAVGHRHQRPARERPARRSSPRRARRGADRHPRPGRPRQARPRPVPGGGRAARRADRRLASWWATASGICWRPGGPGPWAWACSRAATARRSWSGPAPTGSIRTPPTCCATSTRSASVQPSDAGQDGGVGDLVTVVVQDGQHGSITGRVQRLVGMPARGQRPGRSATPRRSG